MTTYTKPNYIYMSALLACGAVKLVNQFRLALRFWSARARYVGDENTSDSVFTSSRSLYAYDTTNVPSYIKFNYDIIDSYLTSDSDPVGILGDDFNECKKIINASCHRTARLKARIRQMLEEGPCVFVTLTFRDDYLNNTTVFQRKLAVCRYLHSFHVKYIANIDFGKKNHREHYHAVLALPKIPVHRLKSWFVYHGSVHVERVRLSYTSDGALSQSSYVRLAKYVNKLCNHAIKETAKRQVIMYSRSNWRDLDDIKRRKYLRWSFRHMDYIRGSLIEIKALSPWDKPFQTSFIPCKSLNSTSFRVSANFPMRN